MRDKRAWAWHGIEPPVDEMLSDPIVLALMRSDGITSAEAMAVMRGQSARAEPCRGCDC